MDISHIQDLQKTEAINITSGQTYLLQGDDIFITIIQLVSTSDFYLKCFFHWFLFHHFLPISPVF